MSKRYPYRFKTEEEMIKSFGKEWRYTAFRGVGWGTYMDHLLGNDYPYYIHELNLNTMKGCSPDDRLPREDDLLDGNMSWMICWDMLTETVKLPNYKPKQIKIVNKIKIVNMNDKYIEILTVSEKLAS